MHCVNYCSLVECALALCIRQHYRLGFCDAPRLIMLAAMNINVDSLSLALGILPLIPTLRVLTVQLLTHPDFCSPKTTHLSLCNLTQISLLSWQEGLRQIMFVREE